MKWILLLIVAYISIMTYYYYDAPAYIAILIFPPCVIGILVMAVVVFGAFLGMLSMY